MSTQTLLSTFEPLPVPPDRLFRLTPERYEGMIEHGLLPAGDRDRVVLLDGLLIAEASGKLHPITIDVYEAMVDHDLLTADDKIELLDGLMVQKMTKGDPHATAVFLLRDALRDLGLKGWHERTEAAIALPGGPTGRSSMPEPDVTLVRGGVRDYRDRKPGPADLALVVEVADSSLRKDRHKRLPRYAWAGIPVAWLVNLTNETVEVYTNPTGPAESATYNEKTIYKPGDHIPVMIDGREVGQIAVSDILP